VEPVYLYVYDLGYFLESL